MKEGRLAEALYVKAPFQPIMKSARPCRRWRGVAGEGVGWVGVWVGSMEG